MGLGGELTKPFSPTDEAGLKQRCGMIAASIRERGSVMWAMINSLYRRYFRARLVEMPKLRNGAMP